MAYLKIESLPACLQTAGECKAKNEGVLSDSEAI